MRVRNRAVCLCHGSWKAALCSGWWPCKRSFKNRAAQLARSLKLQWITKPINPIKKKWNPATVRHFEQYLHHGLFFQLTQGSGWPELQLCREPCVATASSVLSIPDFHSLQITAECLWSPKISCRSCYHSDFFAEFFSCRIWVFTWNMLGLYIGFSLRMSWQTKWEIWVHGGALGQQNRSSRIFFTALQAPERLNPAQMATLLE